VSITQIFKAYEETKTKFCPINRTPCLGEACALWIEIVKPHPNPLKYYEYRGCGLINHPAWISKKREIKREHHE